jgi:uncharacterized protein (TIGR03118 family)
MRRTSSGDTLPRTGSVRRRLGARAPRVVGAVAAAAALTVGILAVPSGAGAASTHSTYTRTDLVSDAAGVGTATVQDPNLVNPWGMSDGPPGGGTPLWVSNEGSDNTTLYSGDVSGSPFSIVPLVVAIPGGKPTGQVFNGGGGFNVTQGMNSLSSVFIFASETGEITGWNPTESPNTTAIMATSTPGAMYTGLALATATAGRELYATNFKAGTIDVFDSTFTPVHTMGAFVDRHLPGAYSPYTVAALNGMIYVAYARRDRTHTMAVPKPDRGYIDVFTTDGAFVRRLVNRNGLDDPSGLTIAPTGFGSHTGDLLVSNWGSGMISAYNATTGTSHGFLLDSATGMPLMIDGLRGLIPGNGVAGDDAHVLFSAGPGAGAHGIVGDLRVAGP